MARINPIRRLGAVSNVAPAAGAGGASAWTAIAEMAKMGADFVRPAAIEQATEAGYSAVYRDETGQLKVDTKSVLGGELADAYNSAAYAKFTAQRQIDIGENFNELSIKYQYDPAGFKEASDLYIQSLQSEEGVPAAIREEVSLGAQREANARFNGLQHSAVARDQKDADTNTSKQRDLLMDDYINLMMGGDVAAAEEKYAEIERISQFRSSAAYIRETPAQTEAYLRGVRGAAKAAVLARKLEDLSGATSIPDDLRAELDATLKDPDLDPKVRQSLYAATQGRLKLIDAQGIVDGATDGGYEAMVVRSESSGNPNAKASTSSAEGLHQFTRETWQGLVKKYKPSWADGMSASQIDALRRDPAKSSEMFQHFRRENQQALSAAGLPINPATEYLAHFLGAGGAVDLLSKDPSMAAKDALPAKVIEANPFLEKMTVGGVMNWAARKMTMKASDMAAIGKRSVEAIEDNEVRALAASALNKAIAARQSEELSSEAAYQERLMTDDPTLTEQGIMEDHTLSDQAQGKIIRQLRTLRKDQIELAQTMTDLNDENVTFNMYEPKDRNRVDKFYQSQLNGQDPLASEDGILAARAIATRTGFAPKTMVDALRAGLKSDDPGMVARSAEVAMALQTETNTAFAPYGGRAEIDKALSDYKVLGKFNDAGTAAQKMIDARAEHPKNVTDQAKRLAKDLTVDQIKEAFDDEWFSEPTIGVEGEHGVDKLIPEYLQDQMLGEYRDLYQREFLETGRDDLSKQRALDQMKKVYGVNQITGSSQIVMYPPQKMHASVNGSYDWMVDQAEQDVSEFVFGGDAAKRPVAVDALGSVLPGFGSAIGDEKWISAKDIHLVSDVQTRREVNSNQPPSYQVYYMHDGQLELHPQRMVFDEAAAKAKARSDFEAAREHQMNLPSRREGRK